MAELITSISRSDTIPIVKQIEVTKNKGYLTLDVSSFTPRMFYELPAIRFEIYTETNGIRVKYNTVDNVIRTYQPDLFPDHEKIVVCIRNIPNECYLYITPIFDNDSVPARNMLIENGIETGDLWDIIPTSTFPITIGFDGYTEPGYPTNTITGVPPISFKSDGTPLTVWSIAGNMVQDSVPSPDSPVTPEECGERTAQLFDDNNAEYGKWVNSDGTIVTNATYAAGYNIIVGTASEFAIKYYGNKPYSYSMVFYDSNGDFLSRVHKSSPSASYDTFPVPENAVTARFQVAVITSTIITSEILKAMKLMLNLGSTALPYEPFGYKCPITLAGQTQTVYLPEPLRKIGEYSDSVSSDGTVTRRVKKLIFDGTENWSADRTDNFYTPVISDAMRTATVFCTHQKSVSTSLVSENCFISSTGRFNIATTAVEHTTAAWQSYLTEQYANGTPVCVWYVLATAQTETVTVPTLTPAKGSNTLSIGTELPPSSVSVTGGIKP